MIDANSLCCSRRKNHSGVIPPASDTDLACDDIQVLLGVRVKVLFAALAAQFNFCSLVIDNKRATHACEAFA